MLELEFAQISDTGRVRDHNEDYAGYVAPDTREQAQRKGWVFVLADGVGGQERGEVASQAAVESLLAGFRQAAASEGLAALLPRLVQSANLHVYETGRAAGPGGVAMATTIVTCALRFDRATVAHVGDSRCYLIRRGEAMALTRDHTMVSDQLRLGLLSAREAAAAPARHVLSRALGNELFVSVDSSDHQIYPGDVLVLCSDGLHGSVQGSEIAALISQDRALEASARKLVAIANQRDGSDNISLQMIRVRAVERMGMYRGRPYKLH
jgi:serine/threonine protein phosphatase PrpC